MRALIIDCGNFSLGHTGMVVGPNNQIVEKIQFEKTEDALNYAIGSNIDTIKLFGNTEFCLGIKEQIQNQLAIEYANQNNITIEVF
jgi:hypothetical protein